MRLVRACDNFLFLLGTHPHKWVQHPFNNGTNAPYLMQMGRQSERGLTGNLSSHRRNLGRPRALVADLDTAQLGHAPPCSAKISHEKMTTERGSLYFIFPGPLSSKSLHLLLNMHTFFLLNYINNHNLNSCINFIKYPSSLPPSKT